MQKNTAGKWTVFAFDRTTNIPKTGDAANITANIRIDGGAANPVDDTNPTELEGGFYVFDITAAESNGDCIVISPSSVTANIQVIGVPGAVWTDQVTAKLPTNYIMGSSVQTAKDDEIDTIAVDVAGLDGAVMRGTDNAALASVCTEVRLAELAAANLPADIDAIKGYVDDLETRLSALRAGYLDNLSVGAVALDSTVAKEATLNTKIPTALTFTGSDVKATLDGEEVTPTAASKTGYALTSAYDPAKTTAQETTLTTILNRIGAFTGTGWNTILGFFRASMRKDAGVTLPTDIGWTFDNKTDSLEAIKDQIPAAIVGATLNTGVLQSLVAISASEPMRVYRGDYLPAGTFTFSFGTAWDCSGGKKIYFCVKKALDGPEKIDVECTVSDEANAAGTVPALNLETYGITPGNYVYEFERRDSDGTKPRTIMTGVFIVNNDSRKS
mgnify:CR=1 FL=1